MWFNIRSLKLCIICSTSVLQQGLGRIGPIYDLHKLIQHHGNVGLHFHT